MASLLKAQDDLEVIGQAARGEEGVHLAQQLHPDVIVMDMVMPGMNGIAATAAIRAHQPQARILVLSNHTGSNLINVVLRAGASGYVRKDCAYEELIPAIRAVATGKQYIGKQVND